MRALDLFAGTGWGVACHALGIEELGVEIMPAAIETRAANGMATPWFDVWETLRPEAEIPAYDILIASPPCQTFSMAGKGAGRAALDQVLEALHSGLWGDPDELRAFGEQHDERTALVLTPLAQAIRDRPRIVVLEQVPPVMPVWEACATMLRELGYSVVTGFLHAEQYGVPQTRRRAILIARRDGEARLPQPTHSRFYPRDPAQRDAGVARWRSMADGLGWGMTDRPYPTVASSRVTGGPDKEKVGGSEARATIYRERAAGRWLEGVPEPDGSIRVTLEEAALLQSYPADFRWRGTRTNTFRQIGNAVPPLMAQAVLEAAVASDLERPLEAALA